MPTIIPAVRVDLQIYNRNRMQRCKINVKDKKAEEKTP
jgi:hypothetical protein